MVNKQSVVQHVKAESPLCMIEIRQIKKYLPKWLWPVRAKYYIGVKGRFLKEEKSNGTTTLMPIDFEAIYIERKKENCLNGYTRIKKISFSNEGGKQSTRDFINYFWDQAEKSMKEAFENGYLIEIGHSNILNLDREYQEILKKEGINPKHTEIYRSGPKVLNNYEKINTILDERTHEIKEYIHTAFPIDVIEYMLFTRKRIPISYNTFGKFL